MYKLDLPLDRKEAAAIERRRNQEEQRKSRIFNAKNRIVGVDLQGLDQQVADRMYIEDREQKRDRAFAGDALRNDKIAVLLGERQRHDMRELNCAVNEFRHMHQQPESRREFDLYDPDYLKKDKPARVSDDDPRCGISSIQKFDGEDLNGKARRKFQQEQLREWSTAQEREHKQAETNQQNADRLYELKMRELDERASDLQTAEVACRRAINMATSDYNRALDREASAKRLLNKQQELDDNMTELANHVHGDILTENPAVAQSAFGAHRVVPDRWKGMTPEQVADIRLTQELQRKENMRLADEEKRKNAEWERQSLAHARGGMLLEREKERRERALREQLASENKALGSEQNSHKEFLDNEVYQNRPTGAFFMQFNTSTR